MKKVEINIPREVLHYTLEKLSSLEAISNVNVTLTETIDLHNLDKFNYTINTAKLEFIIEKDISDKILQLLLTDPNIKEGRIDIIEVERSLILSSQEGKKYKVLLSIFVKSNRNNVYDFITNYEVIQKELPEYINSLNIINKLDNTAIIEEELSINGLLIKQLTKHTTYPRAVHEIEILSGYLEGSKIIEIYTDTLNGTEIIIIGEFKISKELEKRLGDPQRDIENTIKKIANKIVKIIEKKYPLKE